MDASKAERVAEFLSRLTSAPAVETRDEAYKLLCDKLNAVEDELTNIPYNIVLSATDGRMYPPLEDNARTKGECPGVTRYRSLRHNTRIADHGAIRIDEVKGICLLDKAGTSGKKVQMPET